MLVELVGLVVAVGSFVVALDLITRQAPHAATEWDDLRDEHWEPETADDGDDPGAELADLDVRYAFGFGGGDVRQAVFATILEPSDLLDVEGLPGSEAIDRILHRLVGDLLTGRDWPQPRPHRPTAVLLHGPPGVAMATIAQVIARRLRARLVHVFASQVIPAYAGGSQPLVASAVHRVRRRLPSVVFVDELETLVDGRRRDVRRQRAVHDLLDESLKVTYGIAPLVIGALTTYDPTPPRWLADRFDRVVWVDVSDFERTMRTRIVAGAVPGRTSTGVQPASGRQLREHRRRPARRHHTFRRAA